MAQQMTQEIQHLSGADGASIQAEIEIPPGDAGGGREHLPVEVILQHRRVSARRPGPHPVGPLAQPALVDEEDGAALAERFFLSWGQRTFFHCWMALSSRSRARPVGRWQLQLSLRRMRHTCEGSYRTPCCCSISLATRASVHNPLRYPNCSGPCLRHCSSCTISASPSLDGRPARGARRKPVRPSTFNALAQRFTDWRCTPSRRATSASVKPCSKSRAACHRRRSNATRSRRIPRGNPMRSRLADVTILFK